MSFPIFHVEKLNDGVGDLPPRNIDIHFHHIGKLEDGTVFHSTYDNEKHDVYKLGSHKFRCFEEALPQLKREQKALLQCPPEYAYGKE